MSRIQVLERIQIRSSGPGLTEFTGRLRELIPESCEGVLTLFVRHTSCSLLIQENADPDVQTDLLEYFERLVPPSSHPSMGYLTHTYEGPDDMPAHIKAALLPTSLSIPILNGQMLLGTWQGVYLVEHRARPHTREVIAQFSGERPS